MVASKRSRNHYIPVKYNTVQAFKLHFLESSPIVLL